MTAEQDGGSHGFNRISQKTIFFESNNAGLNQSEIARKYGLTPQAVNLLLAGNRDFAK